MGSCMARKGFLTLSDCGNPAMTACSNCSRPMCTLHLSPTSGFSQCLDCAAAGPVQENAEGEQYDDVWAHRYRNEYYSSSSYRPFYVGSHYDDSYYNSQDVRAFDDSANDRDFADDDTETGGFEAS
jgi:hypothetical protein